MPMSKKFALIGGRNMSVFDINQITEDKSSFIEDDQQSAVIINRGQELLLRNLDIISHLIILLDL